MKNKKNKTNVLILLLISIVLIQSCYTSSTLDNNSKPLKIVVLGSSTAAGTGPENIKNSWVNRYRSYLQNLNHNNVVINLAVGGYTTYHLLPTDTTAIPDRPKADTAHNITAALIYKPDIIIINLPSNDAAYGYSAKGQIDNYKKICNPAYIQNIPVYVTTPQGRNLNNETNMNFINHKIHTKL